MKRFVFIISIFIMLTVLIISCSTQQPVETPQENVKFDSNKWVFASNTQLANYPVKGFAYKDAKMPQQEWDRWAAQAAPAVKKILNDIPDGYVLQITGHTDSRGPEYPIGDKPGNMKISTDRAKTVYDALRNKGVTSQKLTYKGVGSAEPLKGVPTDDPQQRRVTFQVFPK